MQKENKRVVVIIVIAIILILISYGLGFSSGVSVTIKEGIKISKYFISNFTIDEQAVHDALFQYQTNLGGCYAPLHNNTGN